jgi:hypothetical protein
MEYSLLRNQRSEESKCGRSVCRPVQTDHHEGPSQQTTNASRTTGPKERKTSQAQATAPKPPEMHHSLSYDTPTTAKVLALRLLAQALLLFSTLLMFVFISISLHHRGRGPLERNVFIPCHQSLSWLYHASTQPRSVSLKAAEAVQRLINM